MKDKVDFKKTVAAYRPKRNKFELVELAETSYLMIDGHGSPGTSEFSAAIEALYPVAYKMKFASKIELGRDYVVPPLEGLWWADDMASFTTSRDKSKWYWTLMIMTPDWVGSDVFAGAIEKARAKNAPSRLGDVRLETLDEGLCAQTLHVGPFDDEGPVLERMHPRERFESHRQASRDLPKRLPQSGPRKTQDDSAPARFKKLGVSDGPRCRSIGVWRDLATRPF